MIPELCPLTLRVSKVLDCPSGVRTVSLTAPRATELPSFIPGSHLLIDCDSAADGPRNAYSLIGPSLRPMRYEISVLRRPGGAGGSRWIHRLVAGDLVRCSSPRSWFPPVLRARRHLLVAGGIGITPLLSHVDAALMWQRPVELIYGYRGPSGAHLPRLRAALGADRLAEYPDRTSLQQALVAALGRQPLGTHLYLCGPSGLIEFGERQAAAAGWPAERVHSERFVAATLEDGTPFRLRLGRTGSSVEVRSGVSALDALVRAGVSVNSQCRQGVCGECRLPVRSGHPLHRDGYLSDDERDSGRSFMPCVSRSLGPELELDI